MQAFLHSRFRRNKENDAARKIRRGCLYMRKTMLYANYHTHTYRCGHASMEPDEAYVKAAIETGIKILGFTDHCPWPYSESFYKRGVRMHMSELDEYIASIRGLAEKYKDSIKIYVGLECEFFEEFLPYIERYHEMVDYLLLGVHWRKSEEAGEISSSNAVTPEHLSWFSENTIRGMKSGLFRYVNHPDHLFSSYPVFDEYCEKASREICKAALETGLPLEYNLGGAGKGERGGFTGLGYPCPGFWKIAAEMGCQAIVGIDAHSTEPIYNTARIERAVSYLRSIGMEPLRVLEGLE